MDQRRDANASAHEQHVEEAIAELGEDTAPIVPLLRRMLAQRDAELAARR